MTERRKIGSRYGSRTDSADTVLVEGHTRTKEGKGRGPPPRCLGVWGREGRTQPFRRNGRPVRLFTPIFRFLGISSIGLPLCGFRLLKKYIVTCGPFFSFTSHEYSVHPWYVYGMFDLV